MKRRKGIGEDWDYLPIVDPIGWLGSFQVPADPVEPEGLWVATKTGTYFHSTRYPIGFRTR